jgi:hypothetical protein
MEFFLQLNSSELPPVTLERPLTTFGQGLLQVFYCIGDCDSSEPFSGSTLVRIIDPLQTQPQTLTSSPLTGTFPEKVIIGWEIIDDYPNAEELQDELGSNLSKDDLVAFEDEYPLSGDKLLGWPHWIQGVEYPNCPECGLQMKLVFQIDSGDNLNYIFGDAGCSHITQCPVHPNQLTMSWACC